MRFRRRRRFKKRFNKRHSGRRGLLRVGIRM